MPREFGAALVHEGGDAFLGIVGCIQRPQHPLFECQASGQRRVDAVIDDALAFGKSKRSLSGQCAGKFACSREQAPGRQGLQGDAVCDRFLCRQEAAGQQYLLGPHRADQPLDALSAPTTRQQSEFDFRQSQTRPFGYKYEVAAKRQLKAAAERIAVDSADGDLWQRRNAVKSGPRQSLEPVEFDL